jgi:hypothetical protein
MSTGHKNEEPLDQAEAPGGEGSRRVVLQAGIAAAALALFPADAFAQTRPGFPSEPGTKKPAELARPVSSRVVVGDGAALLKVLERAGLDPKRLDLSSILDQRSDIEELNGILHGAAALRKGTWDGVTIQIFPITTKA